MFHPEPFCDVHIAIGHLVMAGINVERTITSNSKGKSKRLDIRDADNDAMICNTYRDGSSWKVRTLQVQDYIDQQKLAALRGLITLR